MTKIEWLLIGIGMVALTACQGDSGSSTTFSPSSSATASGSPSLSATPLAVGAPTPVDAVRMVLPLGGPSACQPQQAAQIQASSRSDGCPVTQRLQQRLQTLTNLRADPICRCQNSPFQVQTVLASQGGTTAQVKVTFGFGGSQSYNLAFTAVRQDGRWLVDDTTCLNAPNTTIYNDPVGPCTAG